ncbi:hemolysin, partial [Burkholderia gladioli]
LLSNQADMMAAASAAGEAVSRRIGDYADKMMKEAASNGDKAGVDAWKEGGANRALMQGAGAALVTGLAGGNAVGGAAGAAIASIASGKLNELSGAIAGSDPTGYANMNQALGNIVANALTTGAGAAVGGESGAFSGYNVDRFNRQLHTEEKALAKQLAEKSKGEYTQAQIEDQMRIMGVSDARDGAVAPGTSEELNGRAPSDPSAGWLNTGLSNENGNPLIIQVMSEANPALQNFIMENYNSAAQGQVPSTYTYAPTPVGLDVWGAVANAAGSVSTAAGRFGAVTAAGATIPSPYAPGLATAAYVATVTGMVADAVVQVVKPDVGKYWTNSGGAMISDRLSTKYPLATPIINEAANNFNGSRLSQSIQDFINSSWARIVNQPENK